MKTTKRPKDQEAAKRADLDEFRKLEIPAEMFPEYVNAREFAKGFRRCTILRMDHVQYAASSGA